ncbi:MAG: hypothetical protein ACR2RE_28745 [Geminicoccaceae bacterium]
MTPLLWTEEECQRYQRIGLEHAAHFVENTDGDTKRAMKEFDAKSGQDAALTELLRAYAICTLTRIAASRRGQV